MRLYYGGYGHHPSGKQYVYWGNDNYRTGQQVVAPVTNKYTNKTYNTMFTIMRTSGGGSDMSTAEAQRLSQGGVGIKFIKDRDVLSLPGAIGRFETKSSWKAESDSNYGEKLRLRLLGMEI